MSKKESELIERITVDPKICHGKPVIRGMRYPVENIMELLSSGMTSDEILEDYQDLEREDILASMLYASNVMKIKDIFYFFPLGLKSRE